MSATVDRAVVRAWWLGLDDNGKRDALLTMTPGVATLIRYDWLCWARKAQLPPADRAWFTWLIIGGRGSGKTRPGAEWSRRQALDNPGSEGLIAGRTFKDVRDFMLYGPSGLMKIGHPSERPVHKKADGCLEWPNGSRALIRVGEEPDGFRGGNLGWAWADELPAWQYPQECWDNLILSLREGKDPRICVTTTPRPVTLLRKIMASADTAMSPIMTTYDNAANLAATFIDKIRADYEGTRLGRQEVLGEMLTDTPGALWRMEWIDASRINRPGALAELLPLMRRIVVGVDPSIKADGSADECGIVAVGLGYDGRYYVLRDESGHYSPLEWARVVFMVARDLKADCIVAEGNQGGEMVRITLHTAKEKAQSSRDGYSYPPVRIVHARRGKTPRAEPVSSLAEQGKISHVGIHAKLEDELTTWVDRPNMKSPNRLDGMVWAMTELVGSAGSDWRALDDAFRVPSNYNPLSAFD